MKKPYKNILVPLDGSKLVETALREALPLAKSAETRVAFLQAVWSVIDIMGWVDDKAAIFVPPIRPLQIQASAGGRLFSEINPETLEKERK